MKKRVLWISPYAPYDKVAHGGGKTHNYYVKYFHHNSNCEITLISLCMNYEEENLDLDGYGISNNIYVMDKTIYSKIHRLLLSGVAFRNPFDKYGGKCLPYERAQIKKMIQQYSKENEPNLIILQWTFSLMLIDDLKKRFPNSKIIAIEEDVSFLNYDRKRLSTPNIWSKYFWSKRYKTLKKVELENLEKTDVVVTNNFKDSQLLINNGVDYSKIYTAAPYIDDYSVVKRERKDKNIIFFGDMSREENYNSAIWFIKKVMPLIKDTQIYFTVIGFSFCFFAHLLTHSGSRNALGRQVVGNFLVTPTIVVVEFKNLADNVCLCWNNFKLAIVIDDISIGCSTDPFAIQLTAADNILDLFRSVGDRHFVDKELELDFQPVIVIGEINAVTNGNDPDTGISQVFQLHKATGVPTGETGKVFYNQDTVGVVNQSLTHFLVTFALFKGIAGTITVLKEGQRASGKFGLHIICNNGFLMLNGDVVLVLLIIH